jgi:L-iditol 2-dehydrogenase
VAVIAGPGTIGLLTLQVIKSLSATVVVLGTNADKKRLALAKELGADHAINIQEEDPKALIHEISHEGFGADVVYECSGASPAATQLLELVRRRGRYVQIGLFGKPVSWDLDQICYKELVVTGSNASVPSAWLRALKLLGSGTVRAESIITDTFCVLDWEEAFHQFENRSGVKILLTPAT